MSTSWFQPRVRVWDSYFMHHDRVLRAHESDLGHLCVALGSSGETLGNSQLLCL
jgi:hypothetical protein